MCCTYSKSHHCKYQPTKDNLLIIMHRFCDVGRGKNHVELKKNLLLRCNLNIWYSINIHVPFDIKNESVILDSRIYFINSVYNIIKYCCLNTSAQAFQWTKGRLRKNLLKWIFPYYLQYRGYKLGLLSCKITVLNFVKLCKIYFVLCRVKAYLPRK